jgi:hypothetical protein
MEKVDWTLLPIDIVYEHILPKLPIDTRIKLQVSPKRISKEICNNLETKLQEIKNPTKLYFENIQGGILRFLDIRKVINEMIYSNHLYFVGDRDEFLSIYKQDIWTTFMRFDQDKWKVIG